MTNTKNCPKILELRKNRRKRTYIRSVGSWCFIITQFHVLVPGSPLRDKMVYLWFSWYQAAAAGFPLLALKRYTLLQQMSWTEKHQEQSGQSWLNCVIRCRDQASYRLWILCCISSQLCQASQKATNAYFWSFRLCIAVVMWSEACTCLQYRRAILMFKQLLPLGNADTAMCIPFGTCGLIVGIARYSFGWYS